MNNKEPLYEKRLNNYLRGQKGRMTDPRQQIIRMLAKRAGHFTVETFLLELKQAGFRGSRATVYSTVKMLVEAGFLQRMPGMGREVQYEWVREAEHHDHLVCTCCGLTSTFLNEKLESIQQQVCDEHGFKATQHSLTIYGKCNECQQTADAHIISLRDASEQKQCTVVGLEGPPTSRARLRHLGFVKGADVEIIKQQRYGPWVIRLQQGQLAMDPKLLELIRVAVK